MANKHNSGNSNSGNYNSGDYNSGNYNSGHSNSGDYNSGNSNSGNYNSGYYNSGYHNSGDYNSGDYNSGHYNSGYHNSGDWNSGDYNKGSYNSGFFNTDEPTLRMFNKDTGLKRSEVDIPYIYLKLTEWDDTTKTLTTRTYHEAWELYWSEASEGEKDKFLNLPNFDAELFKEITDVDSGATSQSCEGNVVEIDGKKYKLTEVE